MTPEQILHIVSTRPDIQRAVHELLAHEAAQQQAAEPVDRGCVNDAMEFIRLVHRSLGPAIIHDSDLAVSRRELRPAEAAAFDAACDLMYDSFGGKRPIAST